VAGPWAPARRAVPGAVPAGQPCRQLPGGFGKAVGAMAEVKSPLSFVVVSDGGC